MERKLNAELWDKMHYLFRDYNDRMVHVQLDYDFDIDLDVLKTVLVCFLEKAPVLHSSFVPSKFTPYWLIKDYLIDDVVQVKDINEDELEDEANRFLTQYIPPEADLQMKVAVFRYNGKSTLCIVENHMCMDGGDFKYFLKALCKNYNDFAEKNISPIDLRTGTRSYESVYGDFSETEKRVANSLYKNINSPDEHGFPFTKDSIHDKSFIAKKKLSVEKFNEIRAVGKKYGATINDMILTAYFCALYELAGFDKNESCSISCAIDLRRHLQDDKTQGVTNHTAWMQCKIPSNDDDIFKTLGYVVESSNQFKKDKFMGLHGLPLLNIGYKVLPHAASEEIIKIGYANPLLAMSNIGVLEVDKLALSGHEPTDGFMSGAVKYKPYALLSVTSVRKELTLSMCCRGNSEDKNRINRFFDLIEMYLDRMVKEG